MTTLARRAQNALIPAELAPVALLPARQAGWLTAQLIATLILFVTGLWATQPELSLSIALSAGPVAAAPRRWWTLPLVAGGVVLAGLACSALGVAPILGAGAAAGAAAALILPDRTHWLDVLNGALGTMAGAALGLFAAVSLLPAISGTLIGTLLLSALVGLVASQGLVPIVLRRNPSGLPSRATVRRTLTPAYRPPVFRALELHERAVPHATDRQTRAGMTEVAVWVYRLQQTRQTQNEEMALIDPAEVSERIQASQARDDDDPFTLERRAATVQHLTRLLEVRRTLEREVARTEAVVEYALAFLEEARAGLALARELPGESAPDRLPEVLKRLRTQAEVGDARRATKREMHSLQA